MDHRKRKEIESALSRRYGMKPEAKLALADFNAKQTDWFGTCPICKETISGTLTQLKAHTHGQPS